MKKMILRLALIAFYGIGFSQETGRLPGSEPLMPDAGDLEEQRKQILDYFQSQIEAGQDARDQSWKPDFSSVKAYQSSLKKKAG